MPVIIFDDLTFGGSFQSMEHARACGWGNLWQANKMHFSSPGLALNILSLSYKLLSFFGFELSAMSSFG
jgi:hypothetical protein